MLYVFVGAEIITPHSSASLQQEINGVCLVLADG